MARGTSQTTGIRSRRWGRFEPLEHRWLLAADHLQLVKDVLDFTDSSGTDQLTVGGDSLFFTADDRTTGRELWVTDGTTVGTRRVRDINPGSAASSPDHLVAVGNTLYFTANDGVSGIQLWRSDGSEAGTTRLSNIPDGGVIIAGDIVALNADVYFINYGVDESFTLWRSDGTVEGTHPLTVGAEAPIEPRELTVSGGFLYFAAANSAGDLELWRSDGSANGTAELKNINLSDTSYPINLTDVDGKLYFSADDGSGRALWVSDGTAEGTVKVTDTSTPAGLSQPVILGSANGVVYVAAQNGNLHYELWKIETSGNVTHVSGAGVQWIDPVRAASLGNLIFFVAQDANGAELWRSDGTAAGTFRTRDINPGANGSQPSEFTVFDNALFFVARDASSAPRLWRSDGTLKGTTRISESAWYPSDLEVFAGRLFFAAQDNAGRELWSSNGSVAGTSRFVDIVTQSTLTARPTGLTQWGNDVFFFFETQLFKTDGTAEGTEFITDIDGINGIHSFGISDVVVVNGKVYFTAQSANSVEQPWVSDGTAAGTKMLKLIGTGSFTSVGGFEGAGDYVYFFRTDFAGKKLWRTDGTEAGTLALGSISTSGIVEVGGKVIFGGGDPGQGLELWTTDGTVAGTKILKEIRPGPNGGLASRVVELNGTAYFLALGNTLPLALWRSDGTEDGTVPVVDITNFAIQNTSLNLAGDSLYIVGASSTYGDYRVWKSDGTASGTIALRDFHVPTSNGFPRDFVAAGEFVYFRVDNGVNGDELWRTDGTPSGTILVSDITSGSAATTITRMTSAGGALYFLVGDDAFFAEPGPVLWKSDGTAAGTLPVTEFLTEAEQFVDYRDLTAVGDILYLVARDPYIGSAPWILDVRTPGDANNDGIVDGADYTAWADSFLTSPTTSITFNAGDFNRDGFVDGADYTLWADHFNPSAAPSPAALVADQVASPSAVPAPAVDVVLTDNQLAAPTTKSTDHFEDHWLGWLAIARLAREESEVGLFRKASGR